MSELILSYPYNTEDKTIKAAVKEFSANPSKIVEVSFPNKRLNVLKIVTNDYKLYVSKVKPKDKDAYIDLGKSLADIFVGMTIRETKELCSMTLKLNKNIAVVEFDWSTLVSYKQRAEGWFCLLEDEVVHDFFA